MILALRVIGIGRLLVIESDAGHSMPKSSSELLRKLEKVIKEDPPDPEDAGPAALQEVKSQLLTSTTDSEAQARAVTNLRDKAQRASAVQKDLQTKSNLLLEGGMPSLTEWFRLQRGIEEVIQIVF
jgi:hypothetical protein